VQFPYTEHPFEAMLAAQAAAGGVSTVVLLGGAKRAEPRDAWRNWILLACVWATIVLPLLPTFVAGMGEPRPEDDAFYRAAYLPIEVGLVAAAFVGGRPVRIVLSLVWIGLVAVVSRWIEGSNWEGAALHTATAWVVWGIARAPTTKVVPRDRNEAVTDFLAEDAGFLVLGTLLGAAVSTFVLQRGTDGSDEWSYTFQAALFAKGRAYGAVPPCHESFRSFWVFWREDRLFSQYQPGWPIFMVPFVWARAIWLAGPVSLGLLAMFGGRLARIATYAHSGREDVARSGGRFAALSLCFANTLLINGGSRFPHLFVAALWCVCLERAWVLLDARTRREALGAAAGLGFAAGWLVTTRVPEGGLLVGVLFLLARGLVKRKVSFLSILLAGAVSAAWLVLLVVVSKAQTGRWLQLPYQLTMEFYPWNIVHYSAPLPYLAKWHVPLGAGTYSWWPLVPGIGLAGCLVGLRSPARRVVGMLGFGSLLMLFYYGSLEMGRGTDFGYGPRYQLQTVVPMAIGGALVWAEARLFLERGRSLLAIGAAFSFVGVVVAAIYTFPHNHEVVDDSMRVLQAMKKANLGRAIVIVPPGVGRYGDLDYPRNLPLDLYDQHVLVANGRDKQCLLNSFPDRAIYRAEGRSDPHFVRER
jgi:hypothetical protein